MSAITWVALAAGLVAVATGLIALKREQVIFPWLRNRVRWQPWARSEIMIGSFILVETVPRLAGATSGWVLALSFVALVPLIIALDLSMRSRLPRP